jgi:hypothetical protein
MFALSVADVRLPAAARGAPSLRQSAPPAATPDFEQPQQIEPKVTRRAAGRAHVSVSLLSV